MDQQPKNSLTNRIYRFLVVIFSLAILGVLIKYIALPLLDENRDNQIFFSPPGLYLDPNKPMAHLVLSITEEESNIPRAYVVGVTTIWLSSSPPETSTCFSNLQINSSLRFTEEMIVLLQENFGVPEGTNIPIKNLPTSYAIKDDTCFYGENARPIFGQLLKESFSDTTQERSLTVNTVVPPYYYPYDEYVIEVSVALEGVQKSSNDKPVTVLMYPDITVFVVSQWSYEAELVPNQDGTYDSIHITLYRSRALRTLTALLFLITLAFIILTIGVQETSSFLEISVGILFSLWTFQQLLIPEYIEGTTVVHNIILLLYLAFAFAGFIRFIVKPLWSKLGPIEAREVDNKQASTSEAKTEIFISNYKSSYSLNKRFVVIVTVLLTLIGLLRFKKAPKRR